MPKGIVTYKDGTTDYYDDYVIVGNLTIIKTAYDLKIKVVKSGSAKFDEAEFHSKPTEYCVPISEQEIETAINDFTISIHTLRPGCCCTRSFYLIYFPYILIFNSIMSTEKPAFLSFVKLL